MTNKFNKFGLDPGLIEKLDSKRINEPTDIQKEVIPKILSGEDVIAQSKSGTGKTLSYLLPVLQATVENSSFKSLVIAPTNELARQIHAEFVFYSEKLGIKPVLLSGGEDIGAQSRKLKNEFNIMVGVPGRILKLVEAGNLKLSIVTKIIFDEADFLIDLGFLNDITKIMELSKSADQIVVLSATLSKNTKKIIDIVHNQKLSARVVTKNRLPDGIANYFFPVTDEQREAVLLRIIETINPYLCIIFVRTKEICSYIYKMLKNKGVSTGYLSGDLAPSRRKREIINFKKGRYQYLVATDLASRGLDIESITHVINYNMPVNELDYLHRAGRTGRMNEEGTVYSLCNELDEGYLKKYAYFLDFKLHPVKFTNNEIREDYKYNGVKPRFNLKELKLREKTRIKPKKEKSDNAGKKKRGKKRR